MEWRQHGSFSLHWQGDVLMARYEGSWNEIAARNMHKQARALWQQRGADAGPWGLLSDLRDWESATPEAGLAWWAFFEDGVRHGMVAATDIMPSALHQAMVKTHAQRAAELVKFQRSANIEEGLRWLAGLGLSTAAS